MKKILLGICAVFCTVSIWSADQRLSSDVCGNPKGSVCIKNTSHRKPMMITSSNAEKKLLVEKKEAFLDDLEQQQGCMVCCGLLGSFACWWGQYPLLTGLCCFTAFCCDPKAEQQLDYKRDTNCMRRSKVCSFLKDWLCCGGKKE